MSAKTTKVLKTLGYGGAAVLAAALLLPLLAPFIPALALALILEGPVRLLTERGLPRSAAAGLCLVAVLTALGLLLYFAGSRVFAELKALTAQLPQLIETFENWSGSIWQRLPPESSGLRGYVEKLLSGFESRLAAAPAKLLELIPALAAATPGALLFAVSMLIGAYFISASLPELRSFLLLQLPGAFRRRTVELLRQLKQSFGRWLKSQLLLSLLCFLELTAAFMLLGLEYALLPALITAVIDALPVLGAGTVLIPWAVLEFASGRAGRGIGLLITYAAVTVLRSSMQAKLLGDQLGLHPLVTLLAIYAGFKVWGVAGMIVFPVAAVTVKQLNDAGVVKLWK